MTWRRLGGNAAAGLVGAIVGAILVLSIEGATRDEQPRRTERSVEPEISPAESDTRLDPKRTILLAWAPGGLPAAAERAVEALPAVLDATTVRAGLDWIERSRVSGSIVDDPPNGWAIPFEIAFIDPDGYAPYVPPSERDAILGLRSGQTLLAETSATLRGAKLGTAAGVGMGLALRHTGSVQVRDVVSDVTTQGYEAMFAGDPPSSWGRVDRFLLMKVRARGAQRTISERLNELLGPGRTLRIRAQGETPFLRYGDAVLPQLHMKAAFGEFEARPMSDGKIAVSNQWRDHNVTSREVPLLGTITCHRSLFPQLEAALDEISDSGLSFTIDPGDFGGCFSPRFIDSNPEGRISHHSWGAAIDLNVAQNRPGTQPDIDQRVVKIMERHGFTWGGRWLIPDGMHFEWVRFP